jgi:hypothetical protein
MGAGWIMRWTSCSRTRPLEQKKKVEVPSFPTFLPAARLAWLQGGQKWEARLHQAKPTGTGWVHLLFYLN